MRRHRGTAKTSAQEHARAHDDEHDEPDQRERDPPEHAGGLSVKCS